MIQKILWRALLFRSMRERIKIPPDSTCWLETWLEKWLSMAEHLTAFLGWRIEGFERQL